MSCKGRILIADRTHEVLEDKLREAGFVVSVEPDHDYESLVAAAQGCVGLVVRSKVIDCVPSLRCIGRVGAGMETIDVDYAESRGIRCLNSPEGNRDAVGEHAVGLLLAVVLSNLRWGKNLYKNIICRIKEKYLIIKLFCRSNS